jgi:flagellar assembly factor FliW
MPGSDLTAETVIFPAGLVGCATWKNFVLVRDDAAEVPIAKLQSLDDAHVSLIVTSPFCIDPEYQPDLSAQDRAELQLDETVQPEVFCTLTVQEDGWLTANLLGPLVVNPTNRRAKQIVLAESRYSTRAPITQLGREEVQVAEEEAVCSS